MSFGFDMAFLFPLLGIMFVGLGIPLKRGKIPPNHFYGFRTRKTLSDEKIWYEANRLMGQDMVSVGVVIVLTAMILLAVRGWITTDTSIVILTAVVLCSAIWMGVHGFSTLRKL